MPLGKEAAIQKWKQIEAAMNGQKAVIEATATNGLSFDRVLNDLRAYLRGKSGGFVMERATDHSIMAATIDIARIGLRLGVNDEAYLTCYKDEAQRLIGYKGLIQLAMRTGKFEHIRGVTVHKNDVFDYDLGDEAFITHKPALTGRGAVIGAYAIAHMKGAAKAYPMDLMGIDELMAIKEKAIKSRGGSQQTPWADPVFFPEMCKKTVVRRGLKYAPVSNDLIADVVAAEETAELLDDDAADDAAPEPAATTGAAAAPASRLTRRARKAGDAPAPTQPAATEQAPAATAPATTPATAGLEAPPDAEGTEGDAPLF